MSPSTWFRRSRSSVTRRLVAVKMPWCTGSSLRVCALWQHSRCAVRTFPWLAGACMRKCIVLSRHFTSRLCGHSLDNFIMQHVLPKSYQRTRGGRSYQGNSTVESRNAATREAMRQGSSLDIHSVASGATDQSSLDFHAVRMPAAHKLVCCRAVPLVCSDCHPPALLAS